MAKKLIETDEELEADAKRREHDRRQKLFDALAVVAKIAIYLIPSALAVFYIIILAHKMFWTNDWVGVEADIKTIMIPIATYFIGVMSKNGLIPR